MMFQDADLVKFAILLLACRLNPAAYFILALHLVSVFALFFINYNPIGVYCLISVIYCLASSAEIRNLSSIRYVLFVIGALNFGAAVEFYMFDYQTVFYWAFPYLINALDLITIILLLTGGRGFVGFSLLHYFRSRGPASNNGNLRYNRFYQRQTTAGKAKK